MAITTCFSSNLGAKAVECNPQDVTGTQRYKFFATALSGNGHKGASLTLSNNNQEESNSTPSSKARSKKRKQKKNVPNHNDNNDRPPPCFAESGTQTNDVKALPSLSSSLSSATNDIPKLNKEQQLMAKIQLEKMAREKERKQQESALPPVTDKQSLETYRVFLEENEKKDFALREKELDEKMKLRLQSIEENLYERYANTALLNKEKVELIRNNKLQSLKRKESALLKRERISDISNRLGHSTNKQVINTNRLDMRMPNTAMKFHKARSMKGQSYSRKAQEDLDLITAYFESNT